jgi:hypothetical protein
MSTTPTLTITGSGGKNIATNTITFNFSEAIRNGLFSVDDIRISNGSINAGSFTNNHQKPTFHPLSNFLNPALALLGQGLKKSPMTKGVFYYRCLNK